MDLPDPVVVAEEVVTYLKASKQSRLVCTCGLAIVHEQRGTQRSQLDWLSEAPRPCCGRVPRPVALLLYSALLPGGLLLPEIIIGSC